MPFLNRQEIAYLFVAACVMAATDQQLPREATHARIGVFSIGVVFSHYSASYVFLGTLVLGWLFYKLFAALRFIRANGRGAAWPRARKMVLTPSVSLLNVVILVAGIGLWNGLATHTVGGFGTTLVQAVESLRGGTDTGKSEDVSYSLFGAESDSQVMDQYAQLQTFSNLSVYNNDFPTLLQKNAYIFLGYQTVTKGQSTLFQNCDLISYAYPIGLLNSSVNLVYSSNGAKIYG
jgi:hypothetical protein